MARPTKYSPDTEKRICDALRIGATRRAAYGSAGISHETFSRWMDTKGAFRESVLRAENEAELKFTARLAKEASAQDGDWRAAVEWLKRRRRDDWSERKEVTGEDGSPIRVRVEYADIDPTETP